MTENHDRAIGRIEGKLDRLIAEQACAARNNNKFYQKIDYIRRKQDYIDQKIMIVAQRLKKVEEPVAEFGKWRERLAGAVMLGSFIAATVGGSAVAFWQKIVSALKTWS